jgi:hypothetical protein
MTRNGKGSEDKAGRSTSPRDAREGKAVQDTEKRVKEAGKIKDANAAMLRALDLD